MAGELWREIVNAAVEVTPGTPVAPATKRLYFRNVSFTNTRASRPHRYAVGRRDNLLAHTQGPYEAGGSVQQIVSPDENLELFLIGIQGGITPTTPTGATLARLWTFKPGNSIPDSATFERNNGAANEQLAGARINRLTIAGNPREENAITAELFATARTDAFGALTTGLTDRVPLELEGWQTNFYLDAFGATPGTTRIAATLLAWEVILDNQLARKYFADNTLSAGAITIGELQVTANLTFETATAQAAAELVNWAADTKRVARLEFLGPANGIETGFRRFITVDLPGAWTSPDTNQSEGQTRAMRLPMQYVYDPTALAAGLQVRAQNARTAAWT